MAQFDAVAPAFVVAGQQVVLDLGGLATVPFSALGSRIASLTDQDSRAKLVRAMDEFLSQA